MKTKDVLEVEYKFKDSGMSICTPIVIEYDDFFDRDKGIVQAIVEEGLPKDIEIIGVRTLAGGPSEVIDRWIEKKFI